MTVDVSLVRDGRKSSGFGLEKGLAEILTKLLKYKISKKNKTPTRKLKEEKLFMIIWNYFLNKFSVRYEYAWVNVLTMISITKNY